MFVRVLRARLTFNVQLIEHMTQFKTVEALKCGISDEDGIEAASQFSSHCFVTNVTFYVPLSYLSQVRLLQL